MHPIGMNSLERVTKTMGQQEPDRVPMFLFLTGHGARELGLSIRDYFSRPEHVIEGQLRLGQKYQNDCIYTAFYSAIEAEAFGAEAVWADDAPPSPAGPLTGNIEEIARMKVPDVRTSKPLQKVFRVTEALNREVGNKIPIIGAVMSPFSLPLMQLGLDAYMEVMNTRPELFQRLMHINQEFCVEYANRQFEAGATAICYFDPVSSLPFINRETYLRTGFLIARQTMAMIKGPTASLFMKGSLLSIIDDVSKTGTAIAGGGPEDDAGELKKACKGNLTLLGNLDSAEMSSWNKEKTVKTVKEMISKAAPGGGFILSDNLGGIPFQVREETLMSISETVQAFGHYPIVKDR